MRYRTRIEQCSICRRDCKVPNDSTESLTLLCSSECADKWEKLTPLERLDLPLPDDKVKIAKFPKLVQ